MAGTIYSATYPNGITLNNQNATIKSTAVVSAASAFPRTSSGIWSDRLYLDGNKLRVGRD